MKVPAPAGSYTTVELSVVPELSEPPMISTLPSGNRVAVWKDRFDDSVPAGDHMSVVGSNDCALELPPPNTITLPFCSSVAV